MSKKIVIFTSGDPYEPTTISTKGMVVDDTFDRGLFESLVTAAWPEIYKKFPGDSDDDKYIKACEYVAESFGYPLLDVEDI